MRKAFVASILVAGFALLGTLGFAAKKAVAFETVIKPLVPAFDYRNDVKTGWLESKLNNMGHR